MRSLSTSGSLVSYQETEYGADSKASVSESNGKKNVGRPPKGMFEYVPWHRFRARIRIHPRNSKPKLYTLPQIFRPAYWFPDSRREIIETSSPASFPSTPYLREYVKYKVNAHTDAVVFGARDKLRQQLLATSTDSVSRNAAIISVQAGLAAALDPSSLHNGLTLTHGGHCVYKTSADGDCTCRAALYLPSGLFIYVEFVVETSGDQEGVANVVVGLATSDYPATSVLGECENSVGVRSDLALLASSSPVCQGKLQMDADSHKYAARQDDGDARAVSTATTYTIGMLVYYPRNCTGTAVSSGRSSSRICEQLDSNVGTPVPDSAAIASTEASESSTGRGSDSFKLTDGISPHTEDAAYQGVRYYRDGDRGRADHDPSIESDESPLSSPSTYSANSLLRTNLDGRLIDFPEDSASQRLADLAASLPQHALVLYPTISLLSLRTRVWCRFSADDIPFIPRNMMGAPEGVRVYALDGSLVLTEEE